MANATFEETCHMHVGWKTPLALTTNPTKAAMRRYDHSFSLEYPSYVVQSHSYILMISLLLHSR